MTLKLLRGVGHSIQFREASWIMAASYGRLCSHGPAFVKLPSINIDGGNSNVNVCGMMWLPLRRLKSGPSAAIDALINPEVMVTPQQFSSRSVP